jgi:hypothetical protein
MTDKAAAVKVIVGTCAVLAHEMAQVEVKAHSTWQRARTNRKGQYKPVLDLAAWTALFEDMASTALDELQKVNK